MTVNAFATPNDMEAPMHSMLLDCHCDTCGRQITLDELQTDFHREHHFSAIELAALQAMRAYLNHQDPALDKLQFPHSEPSR
jgi:hypothetical protein